MIALALMHGIQVGIAFDRSFYLQLTGMPITLDDIQDTDPALYQSFTQILDMDKDVIDSDILGLTFVREIKKMGSRVNVELCFGGSEISVDSTNRKKYVHLFIEHYFITSVYAQVKSFLNGFCDILEDPESHEQFFRGLKLEDLDRMLGGSDGPICPEDWEIHTEYKGYNAKDCEIIWFWKVVEIMSTVQRRNLLAFWTSIKFLPLEGFRGLSSKLCITLNSSSIYHLPTSQTCFYRLYLPRYPSYKMMKDRLFALTEDYLGCGFGQY